MKNAGWILSGVLVAVFALVAAAPAGDDHVVQKLDEIKTITSESLRLQKVDMHRRLWPNHKMAAACDLGEACDGIEGTAKMHKRMYRHALSEKCSPKTCEAIEKAFVAVADAEDAASEKVSREAYLRNSWLVTASDAEFDRWLKRNGDSIPAEELAFLKACRAEKAKGK